MTLMLTKEEPAGPDSLAYNNNGGPSSTTSVQLALGSDKNRLYAEYGTNFWFLGEVKNNLDRVTVVTSIPITRFRDVKRTPLKFLNCTPDFNRNRARVDRHPQQYAHEWCTKVMPYICLMQAQEKDLLGSLRTLLVDDLYAAIPELNANHQHSRPSRSAMKSHRPKRKKPVKMIDKVKRGLGAVIMSVIPCLITLAMESLSSWIKGKQN